MDSESRILELERIAALAHAVEAFESFVADSSEDADDLGAAGAAHRQEAKTLAVLREMLTEARRGRS